MLQQAMLDRVLAWADETPNVRTLILTGSLARQDGTADEHSDLDIELYVIDPSELLESDDWYRQFGDVLLIEALENPGWHPTRLVYYVDAKIDFMIAPASVLGEGVTYERPFHVLIDKDAKEGTFHSTPRAHQQPPTSAAFLECVNWFYAAAIMWAKHLGRTDPWAAKQRDWDSKTQLLRMLEWDHKARKGWNYDTWYLGVQLQDWVDTDLIPEIAACWSGFSTNDSARALRASLSLFETLSTRTAISLGIVPFDATRVRERVEQVLQKLPQALPEGTR